MTYYFGNNFYFIEVISEETTTGTQCTLRKCSYVFRYNGEVRRSPDFRRMHGPSVRHSFTSNVNASKPRSYYVYVSKEKENIRNPILKGVHVHLRGYAT